VQGFKKAVQQLQGSRIYAAPHTNGRILDLGSDSVLADDGEHDCTKQPPSGPTLILDTIPFETILEDYDNNCTFCVANPSRPYWLQKVSGVTVELVQKDRTAGVYIDQIGTEKPYHSWDPFMGHSLGVGTYWKSGYSELVQSIKSQLEPARASWSQLEPARASWSQKEPADRNKRRVFSSSD